MTERYDTVSAAHYAAFRPSLHGPILQRLVRPGERFRSGLDVGCGTGYSAVALANHCDAVIGIDASAEMLAAASPHARVRYRQIPADAAPTLTEKPFDVVTFAGSLFYTKTETLRRTLSTICAPDGVVLVYDFCLLVDPIMTGLGALCAPASSVYDHAAGLADWSEFVVEVKTTERLGLRLSSRELAHVLLSDSHRHDALRQRVPEGDLFEALCRRFETEPKGAQPLEAELYYGRYRFAPSKPAGNPEPAS